MFGDNRESPNGGDGSSEGSDASDEGIDGEPEVLTTFADIEKMNLLMNQVLSSNDRCDETRVTIPRPPPPPRPCRCCPTSSSMTGAEKAPSSSREERRVTETERWQKFRL